MATSLTATSTCKSLSQVKNMYELGKPPSFVPKELLAPKVVWAVAVVVVVWAVHQCLEQRLASEQSFWPQQELIVAEISYSSQGSHTLKHC